MNAITDESQQRAARVAGFLFIATFAIVVACNYGIAAWLIVPHDAAATVKNITEHELLFRLNIAGFALYSAGVLGLVTALYVVLEPVNRSIAALASLFRLVFALIWLVAPLSMYVALRVLHADYMQVLGPDQIKALAKFYAGGGFEGYYIGLPFWAMGSTLCFYLFYKSRYVPRWLSAGGVISSAWCVLSALAFIIIPDFDKTVNLYWLDSAMGIFELLLGFWLLFRGLRRADA